MSVFSTNWEPKDKIALMKVGIDYLDRTGRLPKADQKIKDEKVIMQELAEVNAFMVEKYGERLRVV